VKTEKIPFCYSGDVTMGVWLRTIGKFALVNRTDVLKAQNVIHPENKWIDYSKIVSMHYCGEFDFKFLMSQL
jgi:hypothetical protein